jgi:hypothetical protein
MDRNRSCLGRVNTQSDPRLATLLVSSKQRYIPVAILALATWSLIIYLEIVFDIESICEEVPGSHHLGKSESSLEHPPRVHLNTRTWVLRRQATSGDGPPDYVAVVADSNRDRKLESVQIRKDILPMVAS